MPELERFKKYSLDKKATIPLYFQVKNIFVNMLQHDELAPGEMIPTEYDLCRVFNVSRTTIRQALSELVNEGVFFRVKGRGTFASQVKIRHNLSHEKTFFSKGFYSKSFMTSSKLLNIKTIQSTQEISNILMIPINSDVLNVKYLLYSNGEPIAIGQTFLTYSFYKNLDLTVNSDVILKKISDEIHDKVNTSHFCLEAVTATKEDCELLTITKVTAIQIVRRVGFNQHNVPIELTVSRYRGDKNVFLAIK